MAKKHHDELDVAKTTYQCIAGEGVEHGHEDRDVNLEALVKWFSSVLVLGAVTFGLVSLLFIVLGARERSKDRLPTPMWVERRKPPKDQPMLLPRPGDHLKEFRQQENDQLHQAGLADRRTGNGTMPANAVDMVGSQGAGAPKTFRTMQELPEDSSGGQTREWTR